MEKFELNHIDHPMRITNPEVFKHEELKNYLEAKEHLKNLFLETEITANLFAGELLVPRIALRNVVTRLGITSIKELAELFNVSLYVIYMQSMIAGIINRISE